MYKSESWTIKKTERWRTDAFKLLRKTLESSLDFREIKPVNPKGNQSCIFIGMFEAEAEAPILWPRTFAKNWLTGKDPDAGKDWRQEEKGMTEGDMVGWHPWLNGHEFEQTPGGGEGQGSLVCCSPGVTKSRTRLWDWITTRRGFQLEEVLLLSKFAKNL